MRQLIQDLRSGDVSLIDAPDPQVRAGYVVVRTTWSLISPTDLSIVGAASRLTARWTVPNTCARSSRR